MLVLRILIATVVLVLLTTAGLHAGLGLEAAFGGGYTDNLYFNSLDQEDSYSNSRVAMKLTPLSWAELTTSGDYAVYRKVADLSNFTYAGGITVIPLRDESPLQLHLTATLNRVQYRDSLDQFDTRNVRSVISLGYDLSSWVRLRTGGKVTSTRYVNLDTLDADFDQFEAFIGMNISLPLPFFEAGGDGSIDVEAGIGRMNASFIPTTVQAVPPPPNDLADSMSRGHLSMWYVSPRFSRPLGPRTGLSITYTYRKFGNRDDLAIFGYSTGFLSPFSSVFEGSSAVASIKSYLIPSLITSVGAGYWDKTYLRSVENRPILGYPLPAVAPQRRDFLTRVFVAVQRPVVVGDWGVLEPTLTIEYLHNNASDGDESEFNGDESVKLDDRFDYSGTNVSLRFVFRR